MSLSTISGVRYKMKDIQIARAIRIKVKDEYNYVNDIAFTPDGQQVASGATNEIVRL